MSVGEINALVEQKLSDVWRALGNGMRERPEMKARIEAFKGGMRKFTIKVS